MRKYKEKHRHTHVTGIKWDIAHSETATNTHTHTQLRDSWIDTLSDMTQPNTHRCTLTFKHGHTDTETHFKHNQTHTDAHTNMDKKHSEDTITHTHPLTHSNMGIQRKK